MSDESPVRLVGTVARICELIRYLADGDGETTVTVISRDLNLPIATVHRLLHLLMEQGFVERGLRFQSYRVGGELFRIGNQIARDMALSDIALPIMESIAEITGEFTMLCLYLPSDRSLTLIRTVASSNPLTYQAKTFVHMSVAWGASGRAIAAHLPPSEVHEIHLAAGPSPVTGEELPPLPEFRAELEATRRRGFACTVGQKVEGAVGIATAVMNPNGKPIASLCLTIPDFRFDPSRQDEYGMLLREKAAAISYAGGYMPSKAAR